MKFSLSLASKKKLWAKKIYPKVHEQKLVSVTFEDAADREPVPWITKPTVIKAYDSNKENLHVCFVQNSYGEHHT